jgi:hypothetical protein
MFQQLSSWPSPPVVKSTLTTDYHETYGRGNPRLVIDCTEGPREQPSEKELQDLTFSDYKNRYTYKILLGLSPGGAFTFVSDAFGGGIDDDEITERSGLMGKLDYGDKVAADKGFKVERLFMEHHVTLAHPPKKPKLQGFSTGTYMHAR